MTDAQETTQTPPCEVVIKWLPADIQSLRPSWTQEQCEQWLDQNRKCIQDRSIELGWEVIECLLPPKEPQ